MSKKDKLLSRFGDELRESLGERRADPVQLVPQDTDQAKFDGRRRARGAALIDIDQIVADEQHRTQFDVGKLEALADSMRHSGQIQPIVVRWDEERHRYVIIAGERRYRAAKLADLTSLRCDVRDGSLSPQAIAEIQLAENCAREDLNPIERARAFRDMIDVFGYTARDLSKRVGVNETTVTRHLKLLKLPDDLQQRVGRGEIPANVAREVARLDKPDQQRQLADQAIRDGMTGDEVAAAATDRLAEARPRRRTRRRSFGVDRQFTVASGTRFRITSRQPLDDDRLVRDVQALMQLLEPPADARQPFQSLLSESEEES